MKTNLIVSIFALFIGNGFLAAQEEMKLEWETRLEHRTTAETGFSQEKGISFAATEKEISVIDNNTGKVKWNKTFKTISEEIRKVDEIIPMWDANTLFLFDKKLGKDKVVCVDMETGNMLWWTEKYQNLSEYNVVFVSEMDAFALALKDALVMIKVRSGEEIWQTSKFKGAVGSYIVADGNLIMLNYKPTALGALFAGLKNQLVKIDMKNGDVIWDTDYIGLVERKVISGEPVLSMKLENGKLFLTLNGLQVYDVNSGTRLWSCAYDVNINEVVKAPMGAVKWGVYNAIADPLIVGQDVYIIDMQGKRKQYIKKYDLNSGKLLWTSPELEGVRVAPNLYLSGDKLVLQVGGVVETQAYIVKRTRQPDGSYVVTKEWRRDFPTIKPCRLMGFNATNGAQLWESERFKKGITNALIHDGKVIACSGKAFYSMNIDNGKENYELSLGDDNIGLATKILTYKDNIVVVGEKGVALHSPSDGKFLKSSKYKKSMLDDMSGQYLLMRTEGGDIACFDLETCKHKRFDARKDAQSYLADDGSYVVVFEKKTASRLSTR
ncbi:MAG: PQQ-binding-like beta-propeller repeat protein [Bacteroidia bacterium]|nr:PQQ-like beta-propeller repeat protein [Bacteroidia bacterium]MCC6768811.1 PQQ-binding-like beta-propeller repeat protein [Bacteroidia bacterium]